MEPRVSEHIHLASEPVGGSLAKTSPFHKRRSIRVLRDGPWDDAIAERVTRAVQLSPSSFNTPPFHIVLIRDRRAEFWQTVETAFRENLPPDRLERQLGRLEGFRGAVVIAVIFEDRAVEQKLRDGGLSPADAHTFVEQGLGIGQMALWLAVTEEGLAMSLQHWHEVEPDVATFVGAEPAERFRLVAIAPIGYPAEEPRVIERTPLPRLVSRERYTAPE